MSLITSLESQKKKKDRVNVFIDGVFAFGLSGELAYLNKIKTGKEITQTEINNLIKADQVERLTNKALLFLGFRPRSEKETKDYLTYKGKLKDLQTEEEKKSYAESIQAAVEKLKKLGYLNDTEFAKWWIEQREVKSTSKRILKLELLRKGVDKELAEELVTGAESEEEKAAKAAEKKAKLLKNLPKEEFRLKLGQFLARRGFDWETIKKIVDSNVQKS